MGEEGLPLDETTRAVQNAVSTLNRATEEQFNTMREAVEGLSHIFTEMTQSVGSREERYWRRQYEQQRAYVDNLSTTFQESFDDVREFINEDQVELFSDFLADQQQQTHLYDAYYNREMKKKKRNLRDFFREADQGFEKVSSAIDTITSVASAINLDSIRQAIQGGAESILDVMSEVARLRGMTYEEVKNIRDLYGEEATYNGTLNGADIMSIWRMSEVSADYLKDLAPYLALFEKETGTTNEQLEQLIYWADRQDLPIDQVEKILDDLQSTRMYGADSDAVADQLSQMINYLNPEKLGDYISAAAVAESNNLDMSVIDDLIKKGSVYQDTELATFLASSGFNLDEVETLLKSGEYDALIATYSAAMKDLKDKYGDNEQILDIYLDNLGIDKDTYLAWNQVEMQDLLTGMATIQSDTSTVESNMDTVGRVSDQKRWENRMSMTEAGDTALALEEFAQDNPWLVGAATSVGSSILTLAGQKIMGAVAAKIGGTAAASAAGAGAAGAGAGAAGAGAGAAGAGAGAAGAGGGLAATLGTSVGAAGAGAVAGAVAAGAVAGIIGGDLVDRGIGWAMEEMGIEGSDNFSNFHFIGTDRYSAIGQIGRTFELMGQGDEVSESRKRRAEAMYENGQLTEGAVSDREQMIENYQVFDQWKELFNRRLFEKVESGGAIDEQWLEGLVSNGNYLGNQEDLLDVLEAVYKDFDRTQFEGDYFDLDFGKFNQVKLRDWIREYIGGKSIEDTSYLNLTGYRGVATEEVPVEIAPVVSSWLTGGIPATDISLLSDITPTISSGLEGSTDALTDNTRAIEDLTAKLSGESLTGSGIELPPITYGPIQLDIPVDGSHAGGLSEVPYDGYVAELHEGERVLTAQEADHYDGVTTLELDLGQSAYNEEIVESTVIIADIIAEIRTILNNGFDYMGKKLDVITKNSTITMRNERTSLVSTLIGNGKI